jgi:hypothetical protein
MNEDTFIVRWRKAYEAHAVICSACGRETCAAAMPALGRWVLHRLSTSANSDGFAERWPSTLTLAKRTGLNRLTVDRHLAKAERAGWLRRNKAKGKLTSYTLHIPDALPVACDQSSVIANRRRQKAHAANLRRKDAQPLSNTADAQPLSISPSSLIVNQQAGQGCLTDDARDAQPLSTDVGETISPEEEPGTTHAGARDLRLCSDCEEPVWLEDPVRGLCFRHNRAARLSA